MVLEMLALGLLAGSGAGLAGTLLAWVRLDARRSRTFAERMAERAPYLVRDVHVDDSDMPVRMTLVDGDLVVQLRVCMHGVQSTWRVRVAMPADADVPAMDVLDAQWARGSVEHAGRAFHAVVLGVEDAPFRLLAEDLPASRERMEDPRVGHEMDRAVSSCGLRMLRVQAGGMEVELLRTALDTDEAVLAVDAALRLARAFLGTAHVVPEGVLAASRVHGEHANSGSSVGVPVMRKVR